MVTLLPFSAALLASNVHLRLAVGTYWLNLLLLGIGLEWSSRYGRKRFVAEGGVARSASIVALAVVQFYFIVSPRLPRLTRLGAGRA